MDIDKFIPGRNYHVHTSSGWQITRCVSVNNSGGKAIYGFGYIGNGCKIDESEIDDACLIVSPGDQEAVKPADNKVVLGNKYRYIVGIRQYNTISEAIDEIDKNNGGTIIVKEKIPHKHHYKLSVFYDTLAGTLNAILECPCQEKNSFLKNDEIADFVNQLIDNQKE